MPSTSSPVPVPTLILHPCPLSHVPGLDCVGQELLGVASPVSPPLTRPLGTPGQAQKESYRQEKKRASKQLFSALTDPSVVIMADSLKVGKQGTRVGPA